MATTWKEIESDDAFAALFVGAQIVKATTVLPVTEYLEADMFWQLSNGTILAMAITSRGSGCDTCGYGGGTEKTFYSWRKSEDAS